MNKCSDHPIQAASFGLINPLMELPGWSTMTLGGSMEWIIRPIDDRTKFECPVCGQPLFPELSICGHVVFCFVDAPGDSAYYHHATDAFSSFLFLELLTDETLADKWLDDPSDELIRLAKAGSLGYRELPDIPPTSALLERYPADLTVHEFEATSSIYGGRVIIGVDS